jgi:hypothetical protein
MRIAPYSYDGLGNDIKTGTFLEEISEQYSEDRAGEDNITYIPTKQWNLFAEETPEKYFAWWIGWYHGRRPKP